MQKIKVIQIGKQSFTLKELNTRVVWELANNADSVRAGDMVGRVQGLLALACPELTEDTLIDLYPSEIEELWKGFEEVNAAFLGAVRLIGLDQAIIGAVREAITTSIGQFAASLPVATVLASGTTATASS